MEHSPVKPTAKGPAMTFTGDVYVTPIAAPTGTSRLSAALVRFTPGARSNWHSHDVGQTLHGGPAPVRRFLPEMVDAIWNREIDPGKVFDLTLPLDEAAEGYRAMDERRAIKTLLRP